MLINKEEAFNGEKKQERKRLGEKAHNKEKQLQCRTVQLCKSIDES